jgi:hypothetical protein
MSLEAMSSTKRDSIGFESINETINGNYCRANIPPDLCRLVLSALENEDLESFWSLEELKLLAGDLFELPFEDWDGNNTIEVRLEVISMKCLTEEEYPEVEVFVNKMDNAKMKVM